jgi:hypothetical protein
MDNEGGTIHSVIIDMAFGTRRPGDIRGARFYALPGSGTGKAEIRISTAGKSGSLKVNLLPISH